MGGKNVKLSVLKERIKCSRKRLSYKNQPRPGTFIFILFAEHEKEAKASNLSRCEATGEDAGKHFFQLALHLAETAQGCQGQFNTNRLFQSVKGGFLSLLLKKQKKPAAGGTVPTSSTVNRVIFHLYSL